MSSYHLPEVKIVRQTHVIDASTASVGRVATKIAVLLMGKHKAEYMPHIDVGDVVLIENVDKLKVSGKKLDQKYYFSHSGHIGGLKRKKMRDVFESDPFWILRKAVYNMLPKNRLRDKRIKRLKVKK